MRNGWCIAVLPGVAASVAILLLFTATATSDTRPDNWPSFRGPSARGVADGQNLPLRWSGEKGSGIVWKTRIPGLAHASPVVWGDRVFVATAISGRESASFRHGLYGDGTASDDFSVHRWVVYALDRRTGRVLWERTAHEGVPRSKRHIKATYANSTPVTDGNIVVAFFGSEGLYAYDFEGNLAWKKDLGDLDAGAYNAPSYEWGVASSPILWNGLVIVQCDVQDQSFIIGIDAETGETRWKTLRDELPSWGTPSIYNLGERPELLTNGSNFIRAYDPKTGKELWRLGGSSKITTPTPVFTREVILIASGRRPEKPIFALRPGARGDITLEPGKTSNEWILWSKRGRGPYMPTPLIYRGIVYSCLNQGILDAYDLQTGKEHYRTRISHRGGGFSASPVASDGRIFFPSEDGDIFVVAAGTKFELLATNPMGERLMATPAIAGGMMYVRGEKNLFAVGSPR
jgi:outer membrane protein assembly factor BamB